MYTGVACAASGFPAPSGDGRLKEAMFEDLREGRKWAIGAGKPVDDKGCVGNSR